MGEDKVGWYEGFVDEHVPSTDNALESKNCKIKDVIYLFYFFIIWFYLKLIIKIQIHTLRNKCPLREFLKVLEKLLRNWSKDSVTDNRWFDEIEPKIDRDSYELAYHQGNNLNITHTKDDVYLVSKPEDAVLVNVNYALGRYSSKYTFNNFMAMTKKVKYIWIIERCKKHL